MGDPVVHFELYGKDAAALREFYRAAFDWHVDTDNEFDYGIVDTHAGTGINGGITAGDGNMDSGTIVYVAVDDMQAALDKVVGLGAEVVMPVTELPMVTLAMFKDPAGNVVGIIRNDPNMAG